MRRQGPLVLRMSSGDVRHDPCKLRSQFHRALWQAGQPPCAPRLGVGGPAPGVGGAGATSGPDVSPQPHPGGAGYRRQWPQGAARTKGAGSLERAPEGRCGRAPAPGRGVASGIRERHWLWSALARQSGPPEGSTGRGTCARQWACPWTGRRRGGNRSPARGTVTHDVRGWRAAV